MRLNYVESFNAFASRTARRRGWPWLAARGSRLRPTPLVWVAGCNQGGCRPPVRGGRPQGQQPARGSYPAGAASSGAPAKDNRRRPARKRLPTAHPQRATASRGCVAGRNAQRRRLIRGSDRDGDAGG
ncbi:hypothetical protein GW17_00058722 [Ensete ventricosum]|nr:hypothetical protein GW17_00058722 [Ensete ventricosum]